MTISIPHYLLFSEARSARRGNAGRWHFVLEAADGREQFEAEDAEPSVGGERLELLAVIRGLEALEQPSRVTLVTPSRYVVQGLRFGLAQWKENDWCWERFGEQQPVKNADLWQRLDRVLQFQQVECRAWTGADTDDLSHEPLSAATPTPPAKPTRRTTDRKSVV